MRFRLLVVCLLSVWSAFAQEPNYVHYTTENGLISDVVYKVQQTKDHLIWLGNHNSVSTFDGQAFKHIGKHRGFPYVSVVDIMERDNGKVVFCPTHESLMEYDPEGDAFESIWIDSLTSRKFYNKENLSVVFDHDSIIQVGFSLRGGGGTCTIYRDRLTEYHQDFTRKGIQLETRPNGVLYYQHPLAGNSVYINNTVYENVLKRDNQRHLNAVQLEEGKILFSSDKQLLFFDNGKLLMSKEFSHNIIGLDHDADGHVWISFLEHGTQQCNIVDSTLEVRNHFLKDYSITSVLLDHEGGYWFSTLRNGVFYTPQIATAYWNEDRGLPSNDIRVINGNGQEEVLVGFTNNGLSIFQHGALDKTVPLLAELPVGEGWFPIRDIVYDKSNAQYWIVGGYIFRFKNEAARRLELPFSSFLSIYLHEKTGDLWMSTRNKLTHRSAEGQIGPILEADFINRIGTNLKDELLFFSRGSAMQLNADSSELSYVDTLYNLAVYEQGESENARWFTTAKKGTIVWSDYGYQTFPAGETYPLSAFVMDQYLWILGGNGTNRIDLQNPEAKPFHLAFEQGVLDLHHKVLYIQNNSLWLGTSQGVYRMDLNKIKAEPIAAPQIIKVVSRDSTYRNRGGKLALPESERNLTFHFKAITFKHRGQYNFEYRLSPGMEDFATINSHEVNIRGLSSGTHTLELRAVTTNNSYSPTTSWTVHVATPFWERGWFILISTLLGATFLFVIFRLIIQRVQKKAASKAETKALIHALKLESFHAQFNPHFTFNAINSIQQHISPNSTTQAKEYLSKFASVMRAVLVNSKKEKIPLQTELEMLTAYLELERLRFGDRLQFEISIDQNIDPDYEQVPPMLFQPLLENAIKHGIFNRKEGGFVKTHFALENNYLTCTIEDNGVGRKAARLIQQHKKTPVTGRGILLVKDRLKLINQGVEDAFQIVDLWNEDGHAMGTRVILKINMDD